MPTSDHRSEVGILRFLRYLCLSEKFFSGYVPELMLGSTAHPHRGNASDPQAHTGIRAHGNDGTPFTGRTAQ